MSAWLSSHPAAVIGLTLWAVGVFLLMPGRDGGAAKWRVPGLVLSAAGVLSLCYSGGFAQLPFADEVLFWLFATGALVCGTLMITARNPVHAALWFAIVTLCTCGLFLIRSAPFLAAATVIVYAGAVIVTFLFVIMLAQQAGAARYDQQSNSSFLATVAGFVMLGAIVMTLQMKSDPEKRAGDSVVPATTAFATPGNPLSIADADRPVGSMKGLGRSLFGDYLFAVELAGTLLLIASVGAIAIAPRREQGAI